MDEPESWAVTAWGERYGLFPEIDPLIAGATATSHTHVTVLEGFRPLAEGRVEIVLQADDGSEEVFAATIVVRPGIFNVEITPRAEGERDLVFRIDAAAGREEVAGGRVRVGSAAMPGGPIGEPAAEGEVGFLLEQQWQTAFASVRAEAGSLRQAVLGPATIVARPDGERLLTAPASGRLEGRPWPHVGRSYRRGETIFELIPRLDPDVSLAQLESSVAALEAELVPLQARVERLDRLAAAGAVAKEEVEQAHGERRALEARLEGARRDREMAHRARTGVPGGDRVRLPAPFDGALMTILATAGQSVEAGASLARYVAVDRLWLSAHLPPADVAGLALGPVDLTLRLDGERSIELPPGSARLAAKAPAVASETGRVELLFELSADTAELPIGLAVEAELAGGASRFGVLLPVSAVVDDAGVSVVYVQTGGESFSRREVRVLARQGFRVAVAGIEPGERVVTVGGSAIRRATLVNSGVGEAHVH